VVQYRAGQRRGGMTEEGDEERATVRGDWHALNLGHRLLIANSAC
jgi:hypothetical protein